MTYNTKPNIKHVQFTKWSQPLFQFTYCVCSVSSAWICRALFLGTWISSKEEKKKQAKILVQTHFHVTFLWHLSLATTTHQSPCLPPGKPSPTLGCTSLPGRSLPGCCHRTPSPGTAHCCWWEPGRSSGSPSLPDQTPSPAALWCSCSFSCRSHAPSRGCSSAAASVCDGSITQWFYVGDSEETKNYYSAVAAATAVLQYGEKITNRGERKLLLLLRRLCCTINTC